MEEREKTVTVLVYEGNDQTKQLEISLKDFPTSEDVREQVTKRLLIKPIAKNLFALRVSGKKHYVPDDKKLQPNEFYDFRLRFKVPNVLKLKRLDIKAYNYYFQQVRRDFVHEKIPSISYEKCESEILGLTVADVCRVALETGSDYNAIVKNYKKFVPNVMAKRYLFWLRKPITDGLLKIKKDNLDAPYIQETYLQQFQDIAPSYLCEEYSVQLEEGGCPRSALVSVDPFHKDQPGIRFCYDGKKDWNHLCSIEDLCYISRRDMNVVISRKNGIPSYMRFNSQPMMLSFVSLLDGYYRLMVKWTFNLCADLPSATLQRLHSMKCHGPVGGEFSYAKLEEKRSNKPGCFILRECESHYNVYYIDVCTKESAKPKTYKIEKNEDKTVVLCKDRKRYSFPSLPKLIAAYRSSTEAFALQECVPPSEYDQSPLLLCQLHSSSGDEVSGTPESLFSSPPQCIDAKNLQVYKNPDHIFEGRSHLCVVYRSIWKYSKKHKVDVAFKILKQEHRERNLRAFMEMAGRWALLQSNAIVKLYGVTLLNPHGMVMQYMNLGPLDAYLKENKKILKQEDLVEAGAFLATALWHLEEHSIVHGNIRCWKLMVATHQERSFQVRLADPGLFTYTAADIHWIPVECYTTLDMARSSTAADVWAYGTTLWQIFAEGEAPPQVNNTHNLMKYYQSGRKLCKPPRCPDTIYKLMSECWILDPHRRKKPQAIMRDINQFLHEVFISTRKHTYSFPNFIKRSLGNPSVSESRSSLTSTKTEDTYVDYPKFENGVNNDDNEGSISPGESIGNLSTGSESGGALLSDLVSQFPDGELELNYNFRYEVPEDGYSEPMEQIFELNADFTVVLQGRIGQGFYGEVYRALLEKSTYDEPSIDVAVKKLKTNATFENCIQDFMREITIMKSLKHPNIVEIKGVIDQPEISLVMEYVQHGSLQSYLKIHGDRLEVDHLLKFALDVARGMEYLGSKNIVHRDLAARNILVANEHHVKISDFGLAQVIDKNGYYVMRTSRDLPIKWYALESLRDFKFSLSSDVWSYGVTLYEMFSFGDDPKLPACKKDGDQQELLRVLESGARLPCPPQCSQTFYLNLMVPCWDEDAHKRPSFSQLCDRILQLCSPCDIPVVK